MFDIAAASAAVKFGSIAIAALTVSTMSRGGGACRPNKLGNNNCWLLLLLIDLIRLAFVKNAAGPYWLRNCGGGGGCSGRGGLVRSRVMVGKGAEAESVAIVEVYGKLW